MKLVNLTGTSLEKYNPIQQTITNGILKMVVKDFRPCAIDECESFKNFVEGLDPRYTMISK